jgi:cytidylate kinase
VSRPLIAIDGPAGSGKSTVAGALAARLGLERLDTGAMYRAVTLRALREGVALDDADALGAVARSMSLTVGTQVLLDGEDVTAAIRSGEVDAAVSAVAAQPQVRSELVRRQREWWARHGGGVVEGRDIGSVVFPDADLKIFLTADPSERARRREVHGAVLARRDDLDSSRELSPLLVPEGAIVVDSTGMTIEQVVDEVLSHL